jgi:hypothetical protein
VVRIHAGEPLFKFNSLEDDCRVFVPILYRLRRIVWLNPLIACTERVEHGFGLRIHFVRCEVEQNPVEPVRTADRRGSLVLVRCFSADAHAVRYRDVLTVVLLMLLTTSATSQNQ